MRTYLRFCRGDATVVYYAHGDTSVRLKANELEKLKSNDGSTLKLKNFILRTAFPGCRLRALAKTVYFP